MAIDHNDVRANDLKWPSIPLLVPHLVRDTPRTALHKAIFGTSACGTLKYDGTNVGKDSTGLAYGRNQTILPSAERYLKTSLKDVRALDVTVLRRAVLSAAAIAEEDVDAFVLYGELMCNPGLYRYAAAGLPGTHQTFGAVIRPVNGRRDTNASTLASKLGAAGFSCVVRGEVPDDPDGGGGDEEDQKSDRLVMLLMNKTLASVLQSCEGAPSIVAFTQSSPEGYESLFDLVHANHDHLFNGDGEGIIIVSPAAGSDVGVAKWKNGSEGSANNMKLLERIISEMDADADRSVFSHPCMPSIP